MSFWPKSGNLLMKIIIVISFGSLLVMMGIVSANVIGRGLFSSPVLGTVEIVGIAGVFLIPFAIVLTERERAHIVVMIMVSRFSPRVQSIFSIISLVISIAVALALIYGGVFQLQDALERPEMVTPVLRIPKAPFISVWIIGCLFLIGILLKNMIEELIKGKKG